MTSLPTATRVKDAGQNIEAQSEMSYDEAAYAPLPCGATVGWDDPGAAVRGSVTTARSWVDTTDAWLETHAQFDGCGNARKLWDAKGNVSEVEYAATYHYAYPTLTRSPVPGGNGSSSALETTSTYDPSTGLVTSQTDANGQTTSFSYDDPLNRVKQVTRPEGGGSTNYEYGDSSGDVYVRTQTALDASRSTDAYQYFDGLGRVARAYAYDGSATERTWSVTNTEYDAMGRVRRVSNPYFAADHSGAASPAAWTTTDYDALGRVKVVKTPDNAQVVTSYSGNEATVTDQAGKARKSVTDALGRLAKIYEAPNDSGYNYLTEYSYDALGNLRTVTQGGQTRTFIYDSLSRLKSATNPESGTVSDLYDANGNLTSRTDARGVVTTYTYDALDRVQTRTYSDATPAVTYKYDGAGVVGGVANSKGRLTSVSSAVSATSYTAYDAMGRVAASAQTTGGQVYQLSYGYDLAGNLTRQTYPSGRVVRMSIDATGRVSDVTGRRAGDETKGYADSYSYAAHGGVEALRLGNHLWEHTLFNSRLQVREIGLGTSATDSSTLKLEYGYGATDNNGNVRGQTVTLPGGVTLAQTYSYDPLNRLETAQEGGGASWKQTYTYDRYGNRRIEAAETTDQFEGPNPEISAANNRIVPRAGEHYRYDAAGNLDRDLAGNTYGYDGEGRQVSFSGGGSYSYDGEGRRVWKVAGIVTTLFVYDASGRLAAEYTANGGEAAAGTSYVTADHLGSARVVTDQGGGVRARHDYLPFGEELQAGVGGRTTGQGYSGNDGVRQGFTGYEKDGETGLNFAQSRYHSPTQGRFTSPDKLFADQYEGDPQSWNLYTYAGNNPLLFTDPTGMWKRVDPDQNGKRLLQWDTLPKR